MKKVIFILLLFFSCRAGAQTVNDTTQLKYISASGYFTPSVTIEWFPRQRVDSIRGYLYVTNSGIVEYKKAKLFTIKYDVADNDIECKNIRAFVDSTLVDESVLFMIDIHGEIITNDYY